MGTGKDRRRTRDHVLADLAAHHVEGFVLAAGHTAHRPRDGFGCDLMVFTHDRDGYLEPGMVCFLIRGFESLTRRGSGHEFDMPIWDYTHWTSDPRPVILVLYDAGRNRAYWLDLHEYAGSAAAPGSKAKAVTLRIPARQRMSLTAIATIREQNQTAR